MKICIVSSLDAVIKKTTLLPLYFFAFFGDGWELVWVSWGKARPVQIKMQIHS